MTRRLGPYAPLSATYASDDALIAAGEKAELLFVRGLAFCSSADSDGYITDAQLIRVVGAGMRDAMRRAEALVSHGVWDRVEGGYLIRGWLKWNKSSEERGRELRKDRDRKRGGIPKDSRRNPDGIQAEAGVESLRASSAHARETRASGDSQQRTEQERTTPTVPPTESPPVPAAPNGATVTQRAKKITDAYAALEPMCRWPAINGIVIKAINAERWSDDEIRDGLQRLAKEGRSVTVETLRTELAGMPPRASPRSTTDDRVRAAVEAGRRLAAGNSPAIEGPRP